MQQDSIAALLLGLGSYAYGREHRAARVFSRMQRVRPFFLVPKWGDGSVPRLLERFGLPFGTAPFGYLGRAQLVWTFVTLAHLPMLYATVVGSYVRRRCSALVVLGAGTLVSIPFALLLLRFGFGARVVMYFGDIPPGSRAYRWLGRFVSRLSDRVVANSRAVAEGWIRNGVPARHVRVIYNGVDLGTFGCRDGAPFRQSLPWAEPYVLVGYVGQLSAPKGIWDFLEAARAASERQGDCRFIVVGDADPQSSLLQDLRQFVAEQGLGERVRFAGRQEDMAATYAAIDMVVVPSRFEDPAPNVILEALASRVPVIATRVGGAPELLGEADAGFLVEKGQPAQVAAAICRLAQDAELRARMGQAGRRRAERLFDIRLNAAQVESVLIDD